MRSYNGNVATINGTNIFKPLKQIREIISNDEIEKLNELQKKRFKAQYKKYIEQKYGKDEKISFSKAKREGRIAIRTFNAKADNPGDKIIFDEGSKGVNVVIEKINNNKSETSSLPCSIINDNFNKLYAPERSIGVVTIIPPQEEIEAINKYNQKESNEDNKIKVNQLTGVSKRDCYSYFDRKTQQIMPWNRDFEKYEPEEAKKKENGNKYYTDITKSKIRLQNPI